MRRGRAGGDAASLLEGTDRGTPRVIAAGEVLDLQGPGRAGNTRRRQSALPIDVARTRVEAAGAKCTLDFVHVHEPFAPSTSSAALRHSRALNVGSFHASSERLLSTLVARRFVESFFGRLDARTASSPHHGRADEPPLPGRLSLWITGDEAGRSGRARGDLPQPGRPQALDANGDRAIASGSAHPAADRGRPAHAHRPFRRLRHPRGGVAGKRPRAGPRGGSP